MPSSPWPPANWPCTSSMRARSGCAARVPNPPDQALQSRLPHQRGPLLNLALGPMPNCDFLAAGPDHKTILQFVVSELDCRVYELTSEHNQSLKEFRSIADFEERYRITNWSRSAKHGLRLQLHPTKAGGRLVK